MAFSSVDSILFTSVFVPVLAFLSSAQTSFRPKALVLPVLKDSATQQYVTTIKQRTPLVPIRLVIDIGGLFVWIECDEGYVSSTYRPARCVSTQCLLAESKACGDCHIPHRPGCNSNTCQVSPGNPFLRVSTNNDVGEDAIALHSTNGSKPGKTVTVPWFIFSCAPTMFLERLASGAKGIAGLGRNKARMPSQFAAAFSFARKFAVCLPPSTTSAGAIFFGGGPYVFLPGIDVSKSLIYTPLFVNPVSTAISFYQGDPSYEYFIGIKSIKVNGKRVPLNTALLSINSIGNGGTKISSVDKYTIMETSIFNAVTSAFIREANLTRVPRVAPFNVCFDSNNIGSTRVGPAVPSIDLVLQSENVFWQIFGGNSVVSVREGVTCLAFLDGGSEGRTSIVIGGYQLENNLVQFDLATSRLGFTSSLLSRQTTCSNFNFTSNA